MLRSSALLSLVALLLAGCDRSGEDAVQETPATPGASAPAPPRVPTGELVRDFAGTPLPKVTFSDPQGRILDLADIDSPVLINLWATWCAPCREEMPALDGLAGTLEDEVRVLTISQDMRGAEVVVPYFEREALAQLEPWLDPENRLTRKFSDGGKLPVTVLFDAEGREVWRVNGAYDWDSEEAIAQVREALAAA
ncbi:TlpA family protein disulfide reductase [Qipengyuania nanhaisediminis]|uniref:TlpA family protein disulfide reductase n=1 Tax=Qipengyuania nanhaisediminis TaxID=604088 RepID=UPI0038B31037